MQTTIGRMITKIVSDNEGVNTYEVAKYLENVEGEKAIIVQLYPTLSEKDVDKMDTTSLHILNKMNELGLSEIRFLNLFSTVCKSERMSTKNLQIDKENLKYIEGVMKEKTFKEYRFILAWGSSMKSCQSATESKVKIVELFRKYNPKGVLCQLDCDNIATDSTEPPHVLYMGIRHKNEVWRIVECERYKVEGAKKNVHKNIKQSRLRKVEA